MTRYARDSSPPRSDTRFRRSPIRIVVVACAMLCIMSSPAAAQHGAPDGEWPSYGGDLGGTKYSGLDQIDATNFDDLEIAWRWRFGRRDTRPRRVARDSRGPQHSQHEGHPADGGRGRLHRHAPQGSPRRSTRAPAPSAGSTTRTWSRERGSPSTPAATASAAWPTGPTATRRASSTAPPTATCWPSTPRPASRRAASATTAASTWRPASRAAAGGTVDNQGHPWISINSPPHRRPRRRRDPDVHLRSADRTGTGARLGEGNRCPHGRYAVDVPYRPAG